MSKKVTKISAKNEALFDSLTQEALSLIGNTSNTINQSALSLLEQAIKIAQDAADIDRTCYCWGIFVYAYLKPGEESKNKEYLLKAVEYGDKASEIMDNSERGMGFFAEWYYNIGLANMYFRNRTLQADAALRKAKFLYENWDNEERVETIEELLNLLNTVIHFEGEQISEEIPLWHGFID